jgi:hypothetical protein
MSEFNDTMPTYNVLGDMLARTGTFNFRVSKLLDGDFGVFADTFLVESYTSEEDAKASCSRLIHQQARDRKRGI